MEEFGARLTLKDNFTATMLTAIKQTNQFKKDLLEARKRVKELEKKREIEVKLKSKQLDNKLKDLKRRLEPFRKDIIQRIAVRDMASEKLRMTKLKINAIHNKTFGPIIKAQDRLTGYLDNVKNKLFSLKTLAAGIVFGFAGKKAYDLTLGQTATVEQNAIALQTMLGKKKGQEAMAWAYKTAAVTPYNANEVVEGVKRLTTYRLDYKKYLLPMGDLAASMGMPLQQSIDFLGTLKSGDYGEAVMRGKDLGIGKEDWIRAGLSFDNRDSLQAKNSQQAIDAVMKILKMKNLLGMMDAQSNTARGIMSNIGDYIDLLGRKMAGIQETGEIVEGGLFYNFKNTLKSTLPLLDKFSTSPAFINLQNQINKLSQMGGRKLEGFFNYLEKHPEKINEAFNKTGKVFNSIGTAARTTYSIIKPFLKFMVDHPKLAVGAWLGFKMVMPTVNGIFDTIDRFGRMKSNLGFLKDIFKNIGGLNGIFNGLNKGLGKIGDFGFKGVTMFVNRLFKGFGFGKRVISGFVGFAIKNVTRLAAFLGMNPIALGIMLAIGAVALLYTAWKKNWGEIREKTKSSVDFIKETINNLKEFLKHPIKTTLNIRKNIQEDMQTDKRNMPKFDIGKPKPNAWGLRRVPYDNYPAILHEGERVLTKQEVNSSKGFGGNVTIAKLAETIIVREEADIDKIADAFVRKLEMASLNYGGVY